VRWNDDPAAVRPMLASTAEAPLQGADLAYEPKYDGIRALVDASRAGVRFWSRLGNDKTRQFPEIADALAAWARSLKQPVLLDGEIVALNEHGDPVGFQNLQRLHGSETGTAIVFFDILRDGGEDVRGLPLRERRALLEKLLTKVRDPRLRISEQVQQDGREIQARAEKLGWEGLIAKKLDSLYKSGKRTPDWRKLKLVRRQACVIGGWTDPRGSRPFFGALILGVHDKRGKLTYVGHTGAGFTDAELGRVWKRLRAIETKASPFSSVPKTNERPHWVQPKLVAEVKFTEWTADGRLRHPTYIGLRDDIKPEKVVKEPDLLAARTAPQVVAEVADKPAKTGVTRAAVSKLLDQLDEIQERGGSGVLELPGGERLEISNLGKIYWPKVKLTKGDLFRHYVRVAPHILPVLADRPLVMKRHPNGINAKPFYQHRAPDKLPAGVRVATVASEAEKRPHLIGGSLLTLLYTAQLASISQDPWFSRIGSEGAIDHVAIDLDPPDDAPFSKVLDVARWVREELDALKLPGVAKTSGAGGLHIYIPMPPDTPYEAGLIFAQILATLVARKHPKAATVERSLSARGTRVYVDFMQNARGKTLASAYSARASEFAGVSAPLTWDELDEKISPKDFTIQTFAARLEAVGDLWAPLRKSKGADLRAVEKLRR
jgi:bifunctional non-homologous end joining protein LigD